MHANTGRVLTWLQPQEIMLDVPVFDREQALETAAMSIGRAQGVDWRPIYRALWRREQSGSTALGEGFALPHARTRGVSRLATVFMRTAAPIAFDAPDHRGVTQLLFLSVPADGANEDHLQLLAMVARLFSDAAFRTQIEAAPHLASATEAFRAGIARLRAQAG